MSIKQAEVSAAKLSIGYTTQEYWDAKNDKSPIRNDVFDTVCGVLAMAALSFVVCVINWDSSQDDIVESQLFIIIAIYDWRMSSTSPSLVVNRQV